MNRFFRDAPGIGKTGSWGAALLCSSLFWLGYAGILKVRGFNLSVVWGGLTACSVISCLALFAYQSIKRRSDGIAVMILSMGYFPLWELMRPAESSRQYSWHEIVLWCCALAPAFYVIWIGVAGLLQAIQIARLAKQAVLDPPLRGSEADEPPRANRKL
jgi:hypothetical protein